MAYLSTRCQTQIWNITLDNLVLIIPDLSGLPFQFQVYPLFPTYCHYPLLGYIISQLAHEVYTLSQSVSLPHSGTSSLAMPLLCPAVQTKLHP